MRKFIGLATTTAVLAGAGLAIAGQGATSSNGGFIDLNVAVTPPLAGTAAAPRGVGVSFDSFTGNRINGSLADNNTSIVVRFNKGFKWNGLLFPACKINPKALSTCSKATKIGTGTGEASIPGAGGAPPSFIPAKLVAYNGKPFSGKAPTLVFIALVNGKPATELDFTAKQQARGPYGLAITSITFPNSSAASLSITKFSVKLPDQTVTRKVHGKSVKVHLLEAPTACNGSWVFAQTDVFSNAPPLTATDSQPCLKR
jgi:hypothetical protein